MRDASFADVWKLMLSVFSHEPVFVQVAIGLGAALVAVMCLEGFYASFFPRRYAARLARNYHDDLPPSSGGRRMAAVMPPENSAEDIAARISALLGSRALQQNRKLRSIPIGISGTVRPKIQRRNW